jgi:hypothetical protein
MRDLGLETRETRGTTGIRGCGTWDSGLERPAELPGFVDARLGTRDSSDLRNYRDLG